MKFNVDAAFGTESKTRKTATVLGDNHGYFVTASNPTLDVVSVAITGGGDGSAGRPFPSKFYGVQ